MAIDTASLRRIEPFHDLPEQQLQWLAEQGEEIHLKTGEPLFQENDPADYMYVFFEGGVQLRRKNAGADARPFTMAAGDVSGVLPYSRLHTFVATGIAISDTRVGRFNKQIFPEMLTRMPELGQRLVGMMMDRVRETTKRDQQQEKLAALGKLAAGLAHELNNPAGAAKRAASSLREAREKLRAAYLRIDCRPLAPEQRSAIAKFENAALERGEKASSVPSNTLEQSDREEELITWMDAHGVVEGYNLAGGLSDAEITTDELDALAQKVGIDALSDVLTRIHYVLMAARLVAEIEQSTTRISELVQAIKEYTYMDQAPEQELDIHSGIESTLTILAHKFKRRSIKLVREYDRTLPKICAFGVELNQVWTNLIVNAIEAMKEGGELRIRTFGELKDVLVEIRDNGSGIPESVQPRIFDPFFTTKGVGEGTGLGLDTVQRIVKKHGGSISLESVPGDTRFTVRLPKQVTK